MGESTTRTAPRSGGGTSSGPAGTRTGQRLSGLVVALGLALFLGGFGWIALVYRPYTVPTDSMSPTIEGGSRVLAEKIDGADGDEVRRGDVVVFTDKTWVSNAPVVKRVVAVGGDTVSCCTDGKLTVNGKRIDEPYLPAGSAAELTGFGSVKVPEGRLFLLGDERQGSLDSTAHLTDAASGTVARSAVQARVDAVVWPWKGQLARPTGFETLGAISEPGPLRTTLWMIVGGTLMILGGAAYGPVAKRTAARRSGRAGGVRPEPAGVR